MGKQTINSVYNNFFKEIIEDKDGNIDKEQLKKELFDFKRMMDNNCRLFDRLSGGIFSKANTDPDVIYKAAWDEIGNEIKSDIRFELIKKIKEGASIHDIELCAKSLICGEEYLYTEDEDSF